MEKPSTIHIYPKDFESKEEIVSLIDSYNDYARKIDREELVIHYTDIVGVMVSGISSIMIGILPILAGLIPSRMASKKDPVEALRME